MWVENEVLPNRTIISQNITIQIFDNQIFIYSKLLPNSSMKIWIGEKIDIENFLILYFYDCLYNYVLSLDWLNIQKNFYNFDEVEKKILSFEIQFLRYKQLFHELENIFSIKLKTDKKIDEFAWKILEKLKH